MSEREHHWEEVTDTYDACPLCGTTRPKEATLMDDADLYQQLCELVETAREAEVPDHRIRLQLQRMIDYL